MTSPAPGTGKLSVGLDWPGRTEGPTEREAEFLALITRGESNNDIAELVYLSINSIKTYTRATYLKSAVRNRVEAVSWASNTASNPTSTASTTGLPAKPRPHGPTMTGGNRR